MPAALDVIESSPNQATIRLTSLGVITPTRFEKTLTLGAGESHLRLRYRVHNAGPTPIDFLWRLHPALNLEEPARLDLPARRVVVDAEFAADFTSLDFPWPDAPTPNGQTDLRLIPSASARTAYQFNALNLTVGWCAVTQTTSKVGFGLAFDARVLSSIGVFATYGGWRGLHTIIPEPGVCHPGKLDQAVQHGTAAHLAPGATLETEVTAVVYSGLDRVAAISRDGDVTA